MIYIINSKNTIILIDLRRWELNREEIDLSNNKDKNLLTILLQLLLSPLLMVIFSCTLVSLIIIGTLQNIFILLTCKKNQLLSTWSEICIRKFSNYVFNSLLLEEEKKLENVQVNSALENDTQNYQILDVLKRIPFLVILFIVWIFYSIGFYFYFYAIHLKYITKKYPTGSIKNAKIIISDLVRLTNFLVYNTESSQKMNWLYENEWKSLIFILCISFFFSLNVLRYNSFYFSPLIVLLIFLGIFVVLIPIYLKMPSDDVSPSFKEILTNIGFKLSKSVIKDTLIAFTIVSFILLLIYSFLLLFFYDFSDIVTYGRDTWYYIIQGLYPGITEEIIFRGYVMRIFRRKNSVRKTIIISSVVFGLIHLIGATLDSYGFSILQVIFATLFGIILAFFRVVSNSLLGPIIIHSTYDCVIYSVLLVNDNVPPFVDYITYIIAIVTLILSLLLFVPFLKWAYNRKNLYLLRKKEIKS